MKLNQIKNGIKNYPHDHRPMLPLHFPSLFRLIWYTGQTGAGATRPHLPTTARSFRRLAGNHPGDA